MPRPRPVTPFSGAAGSGCTNFTSHRVLLHREFNYEASTRLSIRYRVYAESNSGPSDFSNIAEVTVP